MLREDRGWGDGFRCTLVEGLIYNWKAAGLRHGKLLFYKIVSGDAWMAKCMHLSTKQRRYCIMRIIQPTFIYLHCWFFFCPVPYLFQNKLYRCFQPGQLHVEPRLHSQADWRKRGCQSALYSPSDHNGHSAVAGFEPPTLIKGKAGKMWEALKLAMLEKKA